jgi:hypothetical protein
VDALAAGVPQPERDRRGQAGVRMSAVGHSDDAGYVPRSASILAPREVDALGQLGSSVISFLALDGLIWLSVACFVSVNLPP